MTKQAQDKLYPIPMRRTASDFDGVNISKVQTGPEDAIATTTIVPTEITTEEEYSSC